MSAFSIDDIAAMNRELSEGVEAYAGLERALRQVLAATLDTAGNAPLRAATQRAIIAAKAHTDSGCQLRDALVLFGMAALERKRHG